MVRCEKKDREVECMKVILLKDVPKLGKRGDLMEASEGYARNFLIPKELAEEATPSKLNEWKARHESRQNREEKNRALAEEQRRNLQGRKVVLSVSAGEKGKLFGSITVADIADGIEAQLGIRIDKKDVRLEETVRHTGAYPVVLRLFPGIEAQMTLQVDGA